MLVYPKTMFDRYFCMKSFCHLQTLEKRFEKFILYSYNGAQKHEGFVGLWSPRTLLFPHKRYVLLLAIYSRCKSELRLKIADLSTSDDASNISNENTFCFST